MITVYHVATNASRDDRFNASCGLPLPRTSYYKVAEVDTDDMEVAYESTNSIRTNWTKNPNVTAHMVPCRSTSVGDLLETKDGLFLVASFGFESYVEPA